MKRTKFRSEGDSLEQVDLDLSLEKIELLIIQATNSDGFLVTNKTLLKVLGLVDAVFLSYLIDKHKYWKKRNEDKDAVNNSWFFCVHSKVTEELGISEHQIRESKKRLIQDSLITVEKKGVPAKDHYCINFETLYRGLVLENLKDKPSKNKTTIKETIIKENKEDKLSEEKSSDKLSVKERNKIFLPLVRYLSDIIQTKKNMKHSTIQLNGWANDFRKLNETNGISIQRMKNALKWYSKNIGGQYIPVIESGSSFRDKFMKLENAMTSKHRLKTPVNGTRANGQKPKYDKEVMDGDKIR